MPNEDVLASFFKANSNLNISRIDSHSQVGVVMFVVPKNNNSTLPLPSSQC